MSKQDSLVSIDFWDTLVLAETGGKKRHRRRHESLSEVAHSYVEELPDSEIEEAHRRVSSEFDRIWLNDHRTPTTREMVNQILNHLGIPATKKELEHLVKVYEESIFDGPPELAEGVEEILPEISQTYSTALISDTMYSPGRVLRQFLDNHNLLHFFDSFIFSDETGYSKPNRKAFETVLQDTGSKAQHSYHVGDRLDTDIRGAKQAGMSAILFTGSHGEKQFHELEITPDHRCSSWTELATLLL